MRCKVYWKCMCCEPVLAAIQKSDLQAEIPPEEPINVTDCAVKAPLAHIKLTRTDSEQAGEQKQAESCTTPTHPHVTAVKPDSSQSCTQSSSVRCFQSHDSCDRRAYLTLTTGGNY